MKIDREGKMEDIDGKTGLIKEESSSSPVTLGLGVGAAAHSVIARENNNKPLFTEAQARELQHQAFVFKYIANGLPVPLHLVLPILKSVADTFGSGFGGFYKQYPSFVRFNHLGFDYGKMVDPEPHRCRRTDGKKWRCSKNVVPDQKYCERHMHRGRNRSRKPVETSEVSSSVITKPPAKLHAKLGSNTEFVVPNPLGIQLSNTSTPSSGFCKVNTWSTNRCKLICSAHTQISFSRATVASPSSTPGTAAIAMATPISRTTSITSKNKNNLNIYKTDDNAKSSLSYNDINIRSNGKGNITHDTNNISTRIGFSPRSVLQGIIVSGCNHSCLNDRNNTELTELEPGRCRRTDGKKWRCRSAVLPDQKYCATHMHRGAKKRFADSEPALSSAGTVTIARLPSTTTTYIQKAYCTIPNTNLSMSIPASAPLVQRNEKSPSSSDTDTTITDTMNENSYASY